MEKNNKENESSGQEGNHYETVIKGRYETVIFDKKLCVRGEIDLSNKDALVKELTLCLNLSDSTIEFENKFVLMRGTEIGERKCLPVRAGGYFMIEPSVARSSSLPLEAGGNKSMTLAIGTPFLGNAALKSTLGLTPSGEFAHMEAGLEWGCKGSSLNVEISVGGGVEVDMNQPKSIPQRQLNMP